jgi:hypothetical protein
VRGKDNGKTDIREQKKMAGNRAGSPAKKFVRIPSHEANLTEGV